MRALLLYGLLFGVGHEDSRHELYVDHFIAVVIDKMAEIWGTENSVFKLEAQLGV